MRQEIQRQSLHVIFGSCFIALAVVFDLWIAHTILIAGLGIGMIASYLIIKGVRLPGLEPIVNRAQREHEKEIPGKGALMLFFGAVVLMALFWDKAIVVGALGVAVYGDAASTLFGIKFGNHRLVGKKTVEGTLGGILVSLLFLGLLFEWWVALIAAIAGMAAELLPFDDSLTMPIAVAIALTLLL